MMTAAGSLNAKNYQVTGQPEKQRKRPYRRYNMLFCCITPANARADNFFFVLRTLFIPGNFSPRRLLLLLRLKHPVDAREILYQLNILKPGITSDFCHSLGLSKAEFEKDPATLFQMPCSL